MARSDWAALLTEPAAEYIAHTELLRLGLDPYLPQLKKRYRPDNGRHVMRSYPLFPRYILIRIDDAHSPMVRLARGVCKLRPVLADCDGRPRRIPLKIIDAIRTAETRGDFDEILHKGDYVTLTCGVLATIRAVMTTDAATGMVELLTPLFGGTKVRVNASRLTHD